MLGASLLCPSNAFASVRIYALWYPSTNSGQGAAVANSGATIGGQFAVRVVVQPEQGEGTIVSASIIQQSIRELTDAHPVTSGQLAEFQRVDPNPQYGDPTSNVVVLESPFINLAGHNGTYQIDVTVSYVVATGNPPPNNWRTINPPSVSMTLTMNNLVLMDSRSEPYFVWNPAQMTGVPFSAQIQHAQSGVCTLRLEIFTSENNQTPILVKQFTNVPRPGVWQWEWDGKLADGSTAPRGIYLYRLSAEAYVPTFPDRDSNRSDYLSLSYMSPVRAAKYMGVRGSDAQFDIYYRILSDRHASEGKVVVLNPHLTPIHERTLTGDDLNAGDHIMGVYVPTDKLSLVGTYRFVICVKDNHADRDRSHRRLWALPLALTFDYKLVKLTDPPLVEGSPMLFRGKPMPCPVVIKGEVLPGEAGVRPIIALTVEKGYLDGNDVWRVVEAERPVPAEELVDEDVWWDAQASVWRFRMVWQQQLPRTQFSPNLERYRLRAYALCNRSDSVSVADFRVMSMAKPINCPVTSDYTEGNRPVPRMALKVYLDEAQTQEIPVIVPGTAGGPHLGIDYARTDGQATAGMPVNSAEAGKIEDRALPIPQGGLSIIAERGVAHDIWEKSQYYIERGYNVWVYCLLIDALPNNLWNRQSYIGGHRVIQHGKVNLMLKDTSGVAPDDQYVRDEVSTAYGHTRATSSELPAAGSEIDISTLLTRVQDFYEADQVFGLESRQLSLGYLEFNNASLKMVCKNGPILISFEWRATVRVPSSTGPHLHFEVRLAGKMDYFDLQGGQWIDQDGDGVIRTWGQVNPNQYLGLDFGQR